MTGSIDGQVRPRAAGTPRRLVALGAAAAAVFAAVWSTPIDAAGTASTGDVWDVSAGASVTSNSPVRPGAGITDMFGGVTGLPEAGNVLFADFQPSGTEHHVEWRTPAAVSLTSFFLSASHDVQGADRRGFSRFDLYAKSPLGAWVPVFTFAPADPYDATPTPADGTIDFDLAERFHLCANVDPITSDEFRAVFVQRGGASGASGPRVLELDGYEVADCGEVVDRDGDGVPDVDDAYPDDGSRAVSCAPGSYGAFVCDPAPVGFFAPGDTVVALPCGLGFFSDRSGASECVAAPLGTYVDAVGAAAATACPVGTTTSASASTSVDDCVPVDRDGDGVPDVEDAFPDSDLGPTVVIDGADTGVANSVLDDGSSFNDLIARAAAEARNHGQFVRAVSGLTNEWRRAGDISGREKGRMVRAAAQSDLPR